MLRLKWAVLLLLLTSGCSGGTPGPGDGDRSPARAGSPPAADSGNADSGIAFDVYEPVVRHLMKSLETRAAPEGWVVFVTVPYGLSEESFCDRFAGNPIPVRAFREYDRRPAGPSAYIIHICNPSAAKVRWQGPDRATVLVSHHAASDAFCGCDAPYPIPVCHESGKWVVAAP
jgi:hypothetical protein